MAGVGPVRGAGLPCRRAGCGRGLPLAPLSWGPRRLKNGASQRRVGEKRASGRAGAPFRGARGTGRGCPGWSAAAWGPRGLDSGLWVGPSGRLGLAWSPGAKAGAGARGPCPFRQGVWGACASSPVARNHPRISPREARGGPAKAGPEIRSLGLGEIFLFFHFPPLRRRKAGPAGGPSRPGCLILASPGLAYDIQVRVTSCSWLRNASLL